MWYPDGPIELAQHLAYYEDEKHQLGPDDLIAAPDNVSFSRVDARSPDLRFNHTSSAYWFRLDLRNSSSATLTRILEIAYAPLATVELYRVSNEKTFKIAEAGTSVPFDWRSIKYRNPAFSLEIEGRAQSSYYLKVAATSALILPAKLWTPIGFTLHARQDDVFNAFYSGMVAAMIAFNLLVFARLREVVYLSYSVFLLFVAVGVADQLGLAQQYLWPHATRWPDRANYVLFSLALGVFADFMRRMLDVRQVRAAGERVLSAMSAILFAGALLLWIALPMGAWLALRSPSDAASTRLPSVSPTSWCASLGDVAPRAQLRWRLRQAIRSGDRDDQRLIDTRSQRSTPFHHSAARQRIHQINFITSGSAAVRQGR